MTVPAGELSPGRQARVPDAISGPRPAGAEFAEFEELELLLGADKVVTPTAAGVPPLAAASASLILTAMLADCVPPVAAGAPLGGGAVVAAPTGPAVVDSFATNSEGLRSTFFPFHSNSIFSRSKATSLNSPTLSPT